MDDPNPGAVIAVQTFGDFLNFNPHLHIIATDGCFDKDGGFMVGAVPNASVLEELFRLQFFSMLKKEGKINGAIIGNMLTWHHSGFNVYCGESIRPWDQEGIEKLAQYIVRAPISQERLFYIPVSESNDGVARVIYEGKNSRVRETFVALDWLARLVTHIPNRGEHLSGITGTIQTSHGEYAKHQYIPTSKPSGPSYDIVFYDIVFYNNKEKTSFSQKAWYG